MKNNNFVRHEFLSVPTDVNFGNKVNGGIVIQWIDRAGLACAMQWAKNYAVTASMSNISFIQPIEIGNMVRVEAAIIYTGTTSMHIACDVFSKKPFDKTFIKTTHCVLVFVATDVNGKKTSVKKWKPRTEIGKKLEAYAIEIMNSNKDIEGRMKAFLK